MGSGGVSANFIWIDLREIFAEFLSHRAGGAGYKRLRITIPGKPSHMLSVSFSATSALRGAISIFMNEALPFVKIIFEKFKTGNPEFKFLVCSGRRLVLLSYTDLLIIYGGLDV